MKFILTGGTPDTILDAEEFTNGRVTVEVLWRDHNEAIMVVSNGNNDINVNVITEYGKEFETQGVSPVNKLVHKTNSNVEQRFALNGTKVRPGYVSAPGIYSLKFSGKGAVKLFLKKSKTIGQGNYR